MKSPPLLLLTPLLLALPSHGADQRRQEQLECGPSESLLAIRFSTTEEQWSALTAPSTKPTGDGVPLFSTDTHNRNYSGGPLPVNVQSIYNEGDIIEVEVIVSTHHKGQ